MYTGAGVAQVPKEMRLAPLPCCPGKASFNRLDETCIIVGNHEIHPVQAALLQALEKTLPACLAFLVSEGKSQATGAPRTMPAGADAPIR